MKKWLICFVLCLCTLSLTVGVSAEEALFVLDWADLLTAEEESALNGTLAKISERNSANILVATVDSLEGDTSQNYADNLYYAALSYSGLMDGTEDGALFLIAMDEREWAITTIGYGITAIHGYALDHMERDIVPCLSDGAYYDAFLTFGSLCDTYWQADPEAGYADSYYDSAEDTESTKSTVSFLAMMSVFVGFLLTIFYVSSLHTQLHTVKKQTGASAYQKTNAAKITRTQDLFLYQSVSKKPIPRETSSDNRSYGSSSGSGVHISSSGRTHGGRSGKF